MALGSVAHTELDAEIDGNADEQDEESYRNQVEGTDQHEPRRQSNRQANEQVDKAGENKPRRAQSQPDNDHHRYEGDGDIDWGASAEHGVFLVSQRYRSGKAHRCAIFGREVQVRGSLPDG